MTIKTSSDDHPESRFIPKIQSSYSLIKFKDIKIFISHVKARDFIRNKDNKGFLMKSFQFNLNFF